MAQIKMEQLLTGLYLARRMARGPWKLAFGRTLTEIRRRPKRHVRAVDFMRWIKQLSRRV